MAPIEPDTSNSNFQPLFLLGSYLFVTGALTTLIIRNVVYRAYKTLPPSQTTRHRQSKRRKHVQIFTALSTLSLAVTTYYAYTSLSLSYRVWAHERGEMLPAGLWGPGGLIGGGEETVGLELGRWFKDTSFLLDHWEIVVEKTRRFWWSQQILLGSTVLSVFMGIEGRRRKIPHLWAFLTLGQLVSVAFAQSLFFLAVLVTPIPLPDSVESPTHHRRKTRSNVKSGVLDKAANAVKKSTLSTEHAVHNSWHRITNIADHYIPSKPSTWTPHPAVYILPLIVTYLAIFLVSFASHTPSFSTTIQTSQLTLYIPLYIDRLTPYSWGTTHSTPNSARHASLPIFRFISFASITLHLKQTLLALLDNEPGSHHHRHSSLLPHRDQHLPTIERTSTAIGRVLGSVADHPAVANVAWDVILCGLGLVLWATTRGLDVSDILAAVGMARNVGKGATHHFAATGETAGEKIVNAKETAKELADDLVEASMSSPSKRGRGRPRKGTTTGAAGPSSPRRRAAAKVGSDDEENDVYVPPRGLDVQIGLGGEEEPEEDVEAGVLGWGLLVVGGLGLAAAGTLGGTVCC